MVTNEAGEPAFEEVECPKSTLISSVGVPEPPPAPTLSAEAAAAAAAAGSRGIVGTETSPSLSPTKTKRSSSSSKQRNSKVRVASQPGFCRVVVAAEDPSSASACFCVCKHALGMCMYCYCTDVCQAFKIRVLDYWSFHVDVCGRRLSDWDVSDLFVDFVVVAVVVVVIIVSKRFDSSLFQNPQIHVFRCEQVDKKKAAEAAAVAASVRRLYRVREESGVEATRTPDIISPPADLIEAGTAFYGKAEVCVCPLKRVEGAVYCCRLLSMRVFVCAEW